MTRASFAKRDNRLFTRVEVTLTVILREHGSTQRFNVDVKDMSLVGLRFETSFTLMPRVPISITIPSLCPLDATVAWADGFRYGCKFDRALHVAVLDHFVARYRKVETALQPGVNYNVDARLR